MTSESQTEGHQSEDPTVCYCYRMTLRAIKDGVARCGSLVKLQEETRLGMACGGCRISLKSLFDDVQVDINDVRSRLSHPQQTLCFQPGQRKMKAFIVSDPARGIESRVSSSNGLPPQFGECDNNTEVRYSITDAQGRECYSGTHHFKTGETFSFDTKSISLPRPFYGLFHFEMMRANYGGSRMNVFWYNQASVTSTHELGSTGRPLVVVPVVVDARTLSGPNEFFCAFSNPHRMPIEFTLSVFDLDTSEEQNWKAWLPPDGVLWVNAGEELMRECLERNPKGRFSLRVLRSVLDIHSAVSVNFFILNRNTGIISGNHI